MQDPGFDFSLGMFSMANLAKVGKNSNKPTVEEENEDSEDDDPIKDEPKDDDGNDRLTQLYYQVFQKRLC